MLKRIFIIALITGTSQLFIVFALKFISQNSTPEQFRAIGFIDSLVFFLINTIALGLLPATMRNLALNDNWKDEYNAAQSARLSLGFILILFSILAFLNVYYLAFLIAPILAMNGDYALYGRGKPVAGAIIAFLRSVVPFSVVIFFILYQAGSIAWIYFLMLAATYFITNLFISNFLATPNIVLPRLKNMKLYLTSLPLGLVSLSIYFLGLGLVLVSSFFYDLSVISIAYLGLKFYVIFKGVLRLIQQAFLQEMISDKICLKVDQLSSLIGLTFFSFTVAFPNTFISIFFGSSHTGESSFFILIALSAYIYSFFSSITTKSLLEKKDSKYATIAAVTLLITIISPILFSIKYNTPVVISISLLIGECLFAFLAVTFLSNRSFFRERLYFYLKNSLFIIIPIASRVLFSDSIYPFIASAILFFSMIAIFHFRRFNKL